MEKRITGQDQKIELVLDYLTKFVTEQEDPKPRRKLGFRQKGE